ncbi:MAG: hypothetical protein WCA20_20870 [Candidatus Sulfotelmatobacter sp.]
MQRNTAHIPDGAGGGGYEEVVPYDPSEIGFVVAYVMPCDAWFVIPVEVIAGRKTAKLCL